MRISDLQNKIIVNINDGKEIGVITDLEINEVGEIINYYATPKKKFFNIFSLNKEITFKNKDIKKIGEDVILVEIE